VVVVSSKNLLAPVEVVETNEVTWIETLFQAISAVNNKIVYPGTVLLTETGTVALFNPSPV
jgi:hypothetical protein